MIAESGNCPLMIDGINFDWKEIDNWVEANGAPTIINLKLEDEKELIKRQRKKAEGDVNG